jgi:hypothetical protein
MLHCAFDAGAAGSRKSEERRVGFIGYRRQETVGTRAIVRIYMECREEAAAGNSRIVCGDVVDVEFPEDGASCRLHGVDNVLALKKFYKVVFSLEERAREHGNDWRCVMESPERLLEHLRYTRNARDFTRKDEPQRGRGSEKTDVECAPTRGT